jgi:hypothetical protein
MKDFLKGVGFTLMAVVLIAWVNLIKIDPPTVIETDTLTLSSNTVTAIVSSLDRQLYDVTLTNDTGYDVYVSSYTLSGGAGTAPAFHIKGVGYTLKNARSVTLENIGTLYTTLEDNQSSTDSLSYIKQRRQ